MFLKLPPAVIAIAVLVALSFAAPSAVFAQTAPGGRAPIYLWYEPEWFPGVEGSFAYWPGPEAAAKPAGRWGVAGPGISAEFSQGGESEWNSIGAGSQETSALAQREIVVPHGGRYRVWVRYVDHREQTEPFTLRIEQGGRMRVGQELGLEPVVPPNDEYQLYWGFSFGWASAEGELEEGPATLKIVIDKPGQGWRQVDAVLITDDLAYTPIAREKPRFAYFAGYDVHPSQHDSWRGAGTGLQVGQGWKRPLLAGRDFSMWAHLKLDPQKIQAAKIEAMSPYELFFQFATPYDIVDAFHQQFAGRKDLPIMSWKHLLPGMYLGDVPDLSPGAPLRKWLEQTHSPFFIMTNYANPAYSEQSGPATWQALAGPLSDQFLGYIHGEAVGSSSVRMPMDKPYGKDRREHIDAILHNMKQQQQDEWSKFYKTSVPEEHWNRGIACLSVDSIAMAHAFLESGRKIAAYELDATNAHAPMRIAFVRGAARQYGAAWINYASGNFGDACNYFLQQPVVPRGAGGWFHSKYAITDGVDISWYRRFYYLNYLQGASAIYWEQGLANQWFKPGPGEHPIQLSPFGRATQDFQAFVDRLPDRGEPFTPIAFLLSYGHGYERVNYHCKMLGVFPESAADIELREIFNVAWHPAILDESAPITPNLQSMPQGVYGDIYDVLVDRPQRLDVIHSYPVVWAAGDVALDGQVAATLEDYVNRGGTLVVNAEAARGKPIARLLGLELSGLKDKAPAWSPDGAEAIPCVPFEVEQVKLSGAKVLAWAGPNQPLLTRHAAGQGAVITTLVPRMLGLDERAHPATAYLMNCLTRELLPFEIALGEGQAPRGEIMYFVNRTKNGWLVSLLNNRGVDKTQSGIARVDRRQRQDVTVRTKLRVKSAKEWTQPRDLPLAATEGGQAVTVRVHAGDLQVVEFTTE